MKCKLNCEMEDANTELRAGSDESYSIEQTSVCEEDKTLKESVVCSNNIHSDFTNTEERTTGNSMRLTDLCIEHNYLTDIEIHNKDGGIDTVHDFLTEERAPVTDIFSDKVSNLCSDTENIVSEKDDDTDSLPAMDIGDTSFVQDIYGFKSIPIQITGAWKEFDGYSDNFAKGCKWSPDGSCILTCSDDNFLRIFNLPTELWQANFAWEDMQEMSSVLKFSEGELIYDYSWYPQMSSSDPVTCCLGHNDTPVSCVFSFE